MQGAIWINQPIHTEITEVRIVAKVAPVTVGRFCLPRLWHRDGMVTPFPDEEANQLRMTLHAVIIIFQTTRSIAHGMGILAEHEWPIKWRILPPLAEVESLDFFNRGIHPAVDFHMLLIVRLSWVAEIIPFIVQNPRRIPRLGLGQ